MNCARFESMIGMSAILCLTATVALGAGQAVGIKHPVLAHNINLEGAAAYEKAVERVMGVSDNEMLSFVPVKPFVRFCYCPNCHGGAQGSGIYTWSAGSPDQLTCKYCGMVFPNDKYPCDRAIEGMNALGETVTYRYHQDTTRKDLRIFIPGHILMFKRAWVLKQAHALALAYHVTGKEEYARRVVLALDHIAEVYTHYPVMKQWITTFEFQSQTPPYHSAGGKWGRWMASELPSGVPAIYDLVYDSVEFDKLSTVRGYDVREKFETHFLKATWEYTNTFKRHTGNMAPFYLRVAAQIGKVINEPDYVHWAHKWLLEILVGGCFYDGMWSEAPSYHYQVIGGLATGFAELKGYSDPPGYANRDTGKRFDSLDPEKDIAFFAKARHAPAAVGFPDGRVCPIHDTWANTRLHKPRTETSSQILPGYGHAALGRGAGVDQMQAHLHFSGCHGHAHYDGLNLILFAKGREMLSDIGYSHTKLRHFAVDTIGHNLVVVDRLQQNHRNADGDLLAFFPNAQGINVVEADGKRAYANISGLDRYRRVLALIPVSGQDAYTVDVFRVRGGSTHDWLMHGSANHDMTAQCNVKPTGKRDNLLEPGETWDEPRTEGSRFNSYGAIREVTSGSTDGGLLTTFTYADEPAKGVRIHLLGEGRTDVFLGRSPSIRRAGSDSNKVWDYWMPQLVARRTGTAPLASNFVAVHEPFAGNAFIESVSSLALTPAAETAIALQVRHGDTIDTIISTLDSPPYPERVTANGISIRGRMGIVRQVSGRTTGMWLFEGESLTAKDAAVTTEKASYQGRIQASLREADGAGQDAFLTDAELPVGTVLHGAWMIVTHGNGYTHGYAIDRVARRDGKTVVYLLADHGLRISGNQTHEVYFPRRKIPGVNTFRIPTSVTFAARE
ncbi:MAG: heparinase II/III family protein [Lentisphaeria bacterium]|nr:heparinase II/III family protein [Lentisphaeria bacterium]